MNREIKFRGKGYSEWFYGYVQEYHEKFCKRIGWSKKKEEEMTHDISHCTDIKLQIPFVF